MEQSAEKGNKVADKEEIQSEEMTQEEIEEAVQFWKDFPIIKV